MYFPTRGLVIVRAQTRLRGAVENYNIGLIEQPHPSSRFVKGGNSPSFEKVRLGGILLLTFNPQF